MGREKKLTVDRTLANGNATIGMSEVMGMGKASVILHIKNQFNVSLKRKQNNFI
jgi:hypothetical protein